jgi:hypothetical protein
MREVEAELVGSHGGARLADVIAEDVAKRLVEQVRRGVVRHRREADAPGDDGLHAVAGREPPAPEEERLVVPEAIRLDQLRPRP